MKKRLINLHPDSLARITVSLIIGSLLAWLLRDLWTPLLTAGHTFEERSIYVRAFLVLITTGMFFLISWGAQKLLDSIQASDNSPVKTHDVLAIIGGLTGAIFFYLIYGTGTLDTGRVDWLFNLGDNAQHYLGWVFYRNDPWTFPIGFSCSLGYPTGTCMCFTDSIPLLAIPFKVISYFLPATFQYFGLWTLLNFILQGALASLILFEVSRSRLSAFSAPFFFCLADIFLFRVFRYTPLSGQWIVLLALYLYFLNKRDSRWNKYWPLVHGMAVLIQGYFFVMTFVVFCGTLLEGWLKDRRFMPVIRQLAVSLASTALLMWVVGFFSDAVDMSDAGLGYFKANLNAFVNPLAGWSRFFDPLPLAEGTYAMNVNYLGIGIILLTVIGLAGLVYRNRRAFTCVFCNNWGLVLIVPVLVVFALSNVITLNDRVLFTYPLPDPILRLWGVFRGTERMLWPVYYLIFVFAINQTVRLSPRRWVTGLILLAAFGLQLAEVQPQLERFHAEFNDPRGKQTTLKSDFWSDAAGQFETVVILPLSLENWARLTEYAADYRLNINYSYYARYSPNLEPAAKQKMFDLASGKVTPGEMYIIKNPELRKNICEQYPGEFLALVNEEWVFAPGFDRQPVDYPDIALTGSNSNCSRLTLPDFLRRYVDKLIIISVMDDASTLILPETCAILSKTGLAQGLRENEGESYAAIFRDGKVILEKASPQKIEWSGGKADGLPVDLQLTSAGRISGEEDAVILINGRDYSYHQPGLNVVVVDPSSGTVIDTALFPPVKE